MGRLRPCLYTAPKGRVDKRIFGHGQTGPHGVAGHPGEAWARRLSV